MTSTAAATTTGLVAASGPVPARSGRNVDRGVRRSLTEISTMVGRSIRLGRRQLDTLIMAILLPLMLMALFVYVFGGAIDRGGGYIDYVVPGIVLLCVGFGAASTAVPVAADMNGGMVDRLRSMPVHPAAVLTGHVVASVVRNALSTVVVVVAAIAMGFRPDATPVEWLALAGLLTLYVLALSWFAAGVGAVARTTDAASMAGFFMLFLPYLSSAFVETSTMPAALRAVSEHQPITPVIETARGLLTGTPIGNDGWLALAWSLGLLAASVATATTLYVRRAQR
jgi:ABC-2 type transport system permease protein